MHDYLLLNIGFVISKMNNTAIEALRRTFKNHDSIETVVD